MSDLNLKEKDLENAIEESLLKCGGYTKGNPEKFNRTTGLDEATLIEFIKTTQPKSWTRIEKTYPTRTEKTFIDNLCKTIKQDGLLSVLRRRYKDRGVPIKLCYFKPEHDFNTDATEHYKNNILHCTRQLHYSLSNENSIDIVLFMNGIPLVSIELKNQFTGQDIGNAINQYRFDRATKDTIFEFKNRVLVHFAVDLYNVSMTTRLEGTKTYFLPFNQGSHGAGIVGGKGNPPNPDGYVTSYLWEKVLCKDKLLEIIQKYLHLEVEQDKKTKAITKETMIFPRYHQLDVVTKLVADSKANGTGQNYLIQHSAGSGKSNSIAWLSHQLSGLHDDTNTKIFHSIIVLTDRRVLDSQLQDTIYQFDHVAGVVKKVKNGSGELLDAINQGTPIIISTLQKFPFIYKDIVTLNKRFAIILDEAHSSQSGKSAATVVSGLSSLEEALKEYAEQEGKTEQSKEDEEDLLVKALAAQGHQKNLSFFAFTATPKSKTLNRFGTRQPDGTYKAFHIYSMRQAIEEQFILDVLANYTTYKIYYNLAKKIADDPQYESKRAAKAVTRFQSLHPHNIAQKTEIMVEHFNDITRNKIGGNAKAMVVTASRLHAVKYLFAFRDYIKSHHYDDINVLVAFSGEVTDGNQKWTEESINKTKAGETIKESQLKEAFHTKDFNILIVAEKYQTGFDEPMLHTMFVDKKLSDVKAVQTLSRLNRMAKGKTDTFVLDFVNEDKTIKEAFQQFYQATILDEEADPNNLYKLQHTLDDMHVYLRQEVEAFAIQFYSSTESNKDLGKLSGFIKPALERYEAKPEDEQDKFKTVLGNFIRLYAFIVQVVRLFDADLQKFYVYAKMLAKCLPKEKGGKINLDDKLLLEYYKMEKTFNGQIELEKTDGTVHAPQGGTGAAQDDSDPLSVIVEKFNQRFGTEFSEMDKVLKQVQNDLEKNDHLTVAAQNNDKTLFNGLFDPSFNDAMIERYEQNEQFFKTLFADAQKMDFMKELLKSLVFESALKRHIA